MTILGSIEPAGNNIVGGVEPTYTIDGTMNYAGPAGKGVPAGGTTGQFLKKHSNEDYDAEWSDGSYVLPPATANTLGGVKVGTGLSVAGDGTISNTGVRSIAVNAEGSLTIIQGQLV